MKNRKPTPRERFLARLLDPRIYDLRLRQRSLDILIAWPKLLRYRWPVTAIVSCAIRLDIALYTQARDWIVAQEDKRIIIASALYLATLSENIRQSVLVELIDSKLIKLNDSTNKIWQSIRTGPRPTWSEITRAVGIEETFEFPYDNEVRILDSCRWVMAKIDEPERLYDDLMNHHTTAKSAFLRFRLICYTLTMLDSPELLNSHFPMLAPEIVELIMEEEDPKDVGIGFSDDDWQTYRSRLFQLTEIFIKGITDLSETSATLYVNQLLGCHNHPWLWRAAASLIPLAGESEKVVPFLVAWWKRMNSETSHHRIRAFERIGHEQETYDARVCESQNAFNRALITLTPGQAVAFLTQAAQAGMDAK